MIKIAWHPFYNHPVSETHRFPMEKYDLLPQQLKYEGLFGNDNFFEPEMALFEDICLAHYPDYVRNFCLLNISEKEARKTGFIHSSELVKRELTIMGASIQCALFAHENGISLNIAGGTHHAFSDRGEGFCMLNDFAIAARYLQKNNYYNKILIIDLDVHQGNGTAEIFKEDSSVFTFSIHGEKNYPINKEKSDLDVEIKDGTGDLEYLEILDNSLENIKQLFSPDFIFYQSGVDVLESDKLGRMNLSINGCRQRDAKVFEFCKNNNTPISVAMGGGYSPQIKHIIEAHANTFKEALKIV
jgi:acetoin utilization deacetylase AcuC-like enzyme